MVAVATKSVIVHGNTVRGTVEPQGEVGYKLNCASSCAGPLGQIRMPGPELESTLIAADMSPTQLHSR